MLFRHSKPLRAACVLGMVSLALLSSIAVADPPRLPRVEMNTPAGKIIVEVDVKHAPITAANFLRQVDQGLYKGATFYRTVGPRNNPNHKLPLSIVQGGIGPGASILPPIPLETTATTGLTHDDGAISMGRIAPNSAQSEFFVVIGVARDLDFGPGGRNPDGLGYAVFGHVVRGMKIIRRINAMPAGGGEGAMKGQYLDNPVPITSIRRLP